jgi:SAM-dependent methyltransferase
VADSPQDQTARVRAGYNVLSRAYRADFADEATQRQYAEWLGTFDAVVSFFALIHVPLADQAGVIARVGRWLRPDGRFLATVGHAAWTGAETDWLGGGADMWWSHPDVATYRAWIESAGLTIDEERFVPEGAGGHTLFVATRTPGRLSP